MTTDAVGGVWQYSLALARGLIERHGCQLLLVCFGDPCDEDLRDAVPCGGVELESLRLKLEWMPDSTADVRTALEAVERLIGVWQPDLVHSNQYCFGLLAAGAPRVVVAHSDVLGWLAWHRGSPRGTLSGVALDGPLEAYRNLVGGGLRGASAVVCPSRFMAGSISQIYGHPSRVIYNGLWEDLYPSQGKEDSAIVAGRLWDEAKGACIAIQATSDLPLELRLVGPTHGPCGETAFLAAAPNARQLGSLTWRETRGELARAKLYLATSSYEPFGLAALEAALCGCAVVASDIPSYREVWEDAALYYPVGDPERLRSRVMELLESPERAERGAAAARSRALERYTGARMAAEYWNLYLELRAES